VCSSDLVLASVRTRRDFRFPRNSYLRKTTILILSSRSLSRIIKHLFRGWSEFEIVGTVSGLGNLERQAQQLLPELIVADVKPVSRQVCLMVASIKQSSPLSKLILICPIEDFSRLARKCGADACLNDENLAGHLLRTARTLSKRPVLVGAGE